MVWQVTHTKSPSGPRRPLASWVWIWLQGTSSLPLSWTGIYTFLSRCLPTVAQKTQQLGEMLVYTVVAVASGDPAWHHSAVSPCLSGAAHGGPSDCRFLQRLCVHKHSDRESPSATAAPSVPKALRSQEGRQQMGNTVALPFLTWQKSLSQLL